MDRLLENPDQKPYKGHQGSLLLSRPNANVGTADSGINNGKNDNTTTATNNKLSTTTHPKTMMTII